jgi:ribosome-binding factor A
MLGSVMRSIIAPALRECPQECGIVTITEVSVSPDCSYATVYISAMQNPQDAIAFFEKRCHALQGSLSSLKRKRIPLLRFRIDPRSERAERIDRLLQ